MWGCMLLSRMLATPSRRGDEVARGWRRPLVARVHCWVRTHALNSTHCWAPPRICDARECDVIGALSSEAMLLHLSLPLPLLLLLVVLLCCDISRSRDERE